MDSVRVWLVDREYSEEIRNMVRLTYATLDGGKYLVREKSLGSPSEADTVTAAVEVSPDKLVDVRSEELRDRYRREARRMEQEYEPCDTV